MSPTARMPRLLDAVVAISSGLSLPDVLRHIVESAVDLADAKYGALGIIVPASGDPESTEFVEFITAGADVATIKATGVYPSGHGIIGLLITDPKPLRIADLATHSHVYGFPPHHPVMHSFLGVPIRVRDKVFGNLYLTEKQGAAEFTAADEELVVALAGAAAMAVENSRLHVRMEELAVIADRERIARDLHDTVIQRLFATGMGLQAAARLGDLPEVSTRLQQAVDDLDETILEIRGAIFGLYAHDRGGHSVRGAVDIIAAEAAAILGFKPRLHFHGPIDSGIPPATVDHLLKSLREIFSNAARHARATRVDCYLRVGPDLTLTVVDDGVGLCEAPVRGEGLDNVLARATELGGRCTVRKGPDGGVAVEWHVPLPA